MEATPLLARFSQKLLRRVERATQRALGKGWAAASLDKEVAQLLRLCPDPLGVVIDCGANVGEWSAALTKLRQPARLVQIEPDPGLAAGLRDRFPGGTVVEKALSDRDDEEVAIFADKPGSVLTSLYRRDLRAFNSTMVDRGIVRTTTLPSLMAELRIEEIDLLKIDIEGHELAALRGAAGALARVKVLQFEFGGTNIDAKTYLRDFWYLLSDRFTLYRLSPLGPVKISGYSERDETFSMSNFVCVAK